MLTTGLLEMVAAKWPSGICVAVGVVIRPDVPKSDAAAEEETQEQATVKATRNGIFLDELVNCLANPDSYLGG